MEFLARAKQYALSPCARIVPDVVFRLVPDENMVSLDIQHLRRFLVNIYIQLIIYDEEMKIL